MDGAQEQGDVFRAKSEIQAILDAKNLSVKGANLEVRVEAGKERKQWLTTFFNNVRAFQRASGICTTKGGLTHLELRTFEVYHADHPDAAIGKLNKTNGEFEFDEAVLSEYKLASEEVLHHLE